MLVKIAMLAAYAAMLVGMGIYTRSRTQTVNDFVVGNRAIGPWMSAFSYCTTYFSAVLLIGFAGKVGWGFGFSALLIALGNSLIGTYLAWKVLGKRTREMTSRLNVLTMPSFLEARYDSSHMRIAASIIIFVFFVPYAASVFMGLSYLFEQVFAIPYLLALLLMTVLAGIYLVLGGYIAVTLIDFFQGLIMIAGVVIMVYFVAGHEAVGGFINHYQTLHAMNPQFIAPTEAAGWVGLISIILLTSLGTWGLPQMVQKYYGIKSEQAIPVATKVSTLFALLITGGAYYVGATSHLFFDSLPLQNGVPSPDLLMPIIISQTLPLLVGVLILILVLSASMSTLSALVLVASSSVTIDLIKGALKPDLGEKSTMRLMRVLCAVFIAGCLYMALHPPGIILTLMALSWGTVAGAFLAPFLYGLFWSGTTRAGAWSGMITGLTISLLGYTILKTAPAFIDPGLMALLAKWGTPFFGTLAMLVPMVVVPVVSLMTRPYSRKHLQYVFNHSDREEAA